jgi:hypothetical protein
MPVPLQRRDETRQDGFQTLPANAIGSFPEYDERLADRLGIDPPGQGGWLVDHRINSGEQSNSMLAMTASDGNEFIQDCCFLELGCLLITLAKNFEQFVFRLLADLRAHAAPPEVGNIPVRQQLILGNNIDESTRFSLTASTAFHVLPPSVVFVQTPIASRIPERPLYGHVDDIRVPGIDQNLGDVLGTLQPDLGEAGAAIDRLVQSVAISHAALAVILARAHPDDQVVPGIDHHAADRVRPVAVKDRRPRGA